MNKILIATGLYPPEIGGPATYTKLLEDALPSRGFDVRVVSFAGSRRLPKVLRHLHYFTKVFRAGSDCKLIFAQDPVSVGLPAMVAAKLLRKKFVIRMPGDYAWEQSVQRFDVVDTIDDFQTKKYGVRVECLRAVQVFVAKRADVIVTPSNYFKKLVSRWGVSKDRVVTIYNGIDMKQDPAVIEKPSAKTVVTAGRLVPWKGIDMVIRMLADLPEWELRIIGEGVERENLQTIARECGVAGRVFFMGSLPRSEVLGWCKVSDAFVLNTHFESFSFQIVEAMHSGARVITTNVGSIPELIESGTEGVLLTPGDQSGFMNAIESTVSEPGSWQSRINSAQKKAQQFSIEHTVDEVEILLTRLLAKNR
jgi:glycosyltransferase involved in cell wall biosynthesis